jgi:hypothetical protein
MSDIPPPPPPPAYTVPVPRAAVPRRPGIVTAAAALFFIAGGLLGLVALLVFAASGSATVNGQIVGRSNAGGVGVIFLIFAALEIITGALVMRLNNVGRIIGIVLASIGLLSAILQLANGGAGSIFSLALNGFVLYALAANGHVFRRGTAG